MASATAHPRPRPRSGRAAPDTGRAARSDARADDDGDQQRGAHELGKQLAHPAFDLVTDRAHRFEVEPGGVFERPLLVAAAGEDRAGIPAARGDQISAGLIDRGLVSTARWSPGFQPACDGSSGERELAAVEVEMLSREVVDVRKSHHLAEERIPTDRETHRPSQVSLSLGIQASPQ